MRKRNEFLKIYPKLLILAMIFLLSIFLIFIMRYDFSITTITGNTPYDISTLSYDSVSISTQGGAPYGIYFKPDGKKLYEISFFPDDLTYQSTCSDTWNLSSCNYDNVNISNQDITSTGITFKPDGTKMYQLGDDQDLIYQYTCSSAWDLSSCTYDNINISTQAASPYGIQFKPDGTKLYHATGAFGSGTIYQFDCSTAWDLSSCSYESLSLSLQDNSVRGFFFSPDGNTLLEAGVDTDLIFQYTCTNSWNVSSCSYDNVNISTQGGTLGEVFLSSDGTKLYQTDATADAIYQYSFSTLSIDLISPINNTNYSTSPLTLNFSANISDSDKIYVMNVSFLVNNILNQTINNSWNLSSANYDNVNLSTQGTAPLGLFFKPDGTRLYELSWTPGFAYQYECSKPWSLSSCSYSSVQLDLQDNSPTDIIFKPDGTKLYEAGDAQNFIRQYTCSDAWNLSNCTYDNVNILTQDIEPRGIFFKPDGTRLYETGRNSDLIYQYTCSDAWNLSNCTYNNVNISAQDLTPGDVFFKPDGTKLYELASTSRLLHQYTCSDAWNLSSCIYDNFNIPVQNTNPLGIFFKPDGTKMYEVGQGGGNTLIYEYKFLVDNPNQNFSVNLSSEGKYNFTIQAHGFDDYIYYQIGFFTIDITPPTITFSCGSSPIKKDDILTCTCSAVDSLTGVQSTTYTTNPSTATTGDFTTSCTSKDNLNNSDTKNFAYTVTSSTTTSSGGGSSSSSSPSTTKSSLIVNVNPGEPTKISTFQGTGIKEISIIINKQVQNIRIQVDKYDSKPTQVSKEVSGKRYRYLQIETENLNENLDSATVEFEVENSWLDENELTTDEVSIFKFDNQTETWNELETTYNGEENGTHVYSVEINSFSFFAVAEKTKPSLVEEIVDAVAESYETAGESVVGRIIWWLIFGILLVGIILVILLIIIQFKSISHKVIENTNLESENIRSNVFDNEFNK